MCGIGLEKNHRILSYYIAYCLCGTAVNIQEISICSHYFSVINSQHTNSGESNMYEYCGIQALVYNFSTQFSRITLTLTYSMRDSSAPKNSATEVLLYNH
jgi:hypothetical protein